MFSDERIVHEAIHLRKQCGKLDHAAEHQDALLLLQKVSFVVLGIII